MGEMRNSYRILVGNREGKIPFGRLERSWENNIRLDLREIGRKAVDWMHLANDSYQERGLVKMLMELQIP
jgi:hypothetical protein